MGSISSRISVLRESIPEVNTIPFRYITPDELREKGRISSCATPTGEDYGGKAHIKIYNANTDNFYEIARAYDPCGTKCIMELIKSRMDVPEDIEDIIFAVFCLLHEAGHYYDYQKDPGKYKSNYVEAGPNGTLEDAKAYRNRPLEKVADEYALERLADALKRLNLEMIRQRLSE